MPRELARKALEFYSMSIGPEIRVPGVFGQALDVSPSASMLDKLVAFTGPKPQGLSWES